MEQVTFTNMCMIEDSEGRVVVQQRRRSWKGVAFPGGHVEQGESFTRAVIREIREETGLTIEHPRLVAVKDWMDDDGSRYVVLLYRASRYTGTLTSSEEGDVWWQPLDRLTELPLASSMDIMLRAFLDEDVSEHLLVHDEGGWHNLLL
ncbi:MAG: 8-oxo-dGTP diphosphatase [Eubacteriales bacterium]|nr:8-oxo-dGTP diphosphatase [Eubacteriales bacterium]